LIKTSDLKRFSSKEGVPQGVVEKDFVLSVALKVIAESELAKYLVFKGGTAIRKAYFREARFSEDLDFTVTAIGKKDCFELLEKNLEETNVENVEFGKLEEEKTSAGLKTAIKYFGPLEYAQRIKFDFSFRENLVETPKQRQLIDVYGVGSAEIKVLSLEEMLAEKIHALTSRFAPRDLYDAWFLLEKGIKLDKQILEKKCGYYNEEFDASKAVENAKKTREKWERDLKHLLKKLPDFTTIEQDVETRLKQIS
jgi:predicted nucleotidyltransferase component of viral defense system